MTIMMILEVKGGEAKGDDGVGCAPSSPFASL